MYKSYFKIALRVLLRNKGYSLINIAGLALGMTASLFLLAYVSFEFSFDRFHERLDDIYMVRLDSYKGNALEETTMASYYAEAPAIREQYPQVDNFVRLHSADGMLRYVAPNGELVSYFEHNAFYTDSSFFSVFSFPLVLGDKNSVLRNPASMLMSESASKKYFGNEDPIGKVIKLTGWEGGDYVVEGVFKDVPENSHVRFDFLFAIDRLLNNEQFKYGGWYWENFITYLVLKPNTNPADLETGIASVVEANIGSGLKNTNSAKKLVLVPLGDIHLYSSIADAINGNYEMVYLILVIACLVLGIAWLNYLNLATANAAQRSREISIRKVMGSDRAQMIRQFLVESLLISAMAIVITVVLLIVMNAYFTDLVGKPIVTDVIAQRTFWLVVAGGLALGIFICGLYPGIVMSSFHAFANLKSSPLKGLAGERARKVMVVVQFVASILLIASTLTIREQIVFMRKQQTGVETRQKLILRSPDIVTGGSRLNMISAFKNSLRQHPSIKNVSSSSEVPGRPVGWSKEFKLVQQSDEERKIIHIVSVDEDFVPTYGLSLVAGRNFSEKYPSDFGGAVLINETALERLGIKDAQSAIDQQVIDFLPQRIIGVVKDYQQQTVKHADVPLLFQFIPWNNDFLTVSLESQNVREDVQIVTDVYKKTFPGNAVEYYFLDDFMNDAYRSEEQFWNIFKVFSMLAIFISCLGLFGLSSFVIARRTKEIGIRKVLGSSVAGIVGLLSTDFLRLVVIAFILSIPITMIVMNEWLQTFAQRIDIPWWIYAVAGVTALLVAMLTVSSQAIKAALMNPVETLKTE